MAAVGRVLLQHGVPVIVVDVALPSGVWPRPSVVRSYTQGEARLPAVQQQLLERDEFLLEVRDRLEQAQSYDKAAYDKKHRDVEFMVGQWVWVKLLHRPLASLDVKDATSSAPSSLGRIRSWSDWG
jgi:hypothetical protein